MSTRIPSPSQMVLYVSDVAASSAFYRDLLGRPPVEASPNFAAFATDSGMLLGLWARDKVEPAAPAGPGDVKVGGAEVIFLVDELDRVDQIHGDWSRRGLAIAQVPTRMDFGRSFVALDPDGHRLRVIALTV